MSTINGPGEGTWSVFAAKVVEERDRLRGVCDLRLHIMERLEKERDEARAQLAATDTDTGSPCDGHRHCCADRRKLANELLRVRAERDELRSSLDDCLICNRNLFGIINECKRERDEAQAEVKTWKHDWSVAKADLGTAMRLADVALRDVAEKYERALRERDEAVHACAAALAERITWYQRGREEALKEKS